MYPFYAKEVLLKFGQNKEDWEHNDDSFSNDSIAPHCATVILNDLGNQLITANMILNATSHTNINPYMHIMQRVNVILCNIYGCSINKAIVAGHEQIRNR